MESGADTEGSARVMGSVCVCGGGCSLEAGAECRLRGVGGGSLGLAGQGRGEWLFRPRRQGARGQGVVWAWRGGQQAGAGPERGGAAGPR